ncbi:MAG: Uncharacterised protein [Synechococcus sp. CC9902]|nr:MAG: Uncharacterised protein [Synechococcus sp. CC9902]
MIQPDGDRSLTVQVHGLAAVVALPQGDTSDILQPQQAAVLKSAEHQILQVTATAQPTFRFHREADQLSAIGRCCAKTADGSEHVLLGQGPTDIGAGEVGLLQSVWIQPQAEGERTAAEHLHIPNSGDGEQRLPHGLPQPAAEEC